MRLIPARAGSTSFCSWAPTRTPAHPRSRGEHDLVTHGSPGHAGSSPLARGAHAQLRNTTTSLGLIPARAGAPRRLPGRGRARRLIPARAGSTASRTGCSWWRTAHPRSRGEHSGVAARRQSHMGSSPLARGAPRYGSNTGLGRRLIPARAGSTFGLKRSRRSSQAHPRSRGEHIGNAGRVDINLGSSPLARGAHQREELGEPLGGLIPARAGSTGSGVNRDAFTPAHPRSRGEHLLLTRFVTARLGSSPLARGAPSRDPTTSRLVRLIPARAGSTPV